MRLYFVRHGESQANLLRIISNRDLPHPLTDKGRQQAHALAEQLGPIPASALFTSPILRATQTAEVLSQRLGVPSQVTEALREYDCGVLEGQSDEESWRLHREIAEAWIVHRNWERRPEQGESFLDIQARFVPFIDSLIQESLTANSHVILVGHGGLYHLMLPLVLKNIDNDFVRRHPISYTGCIIAEQRADGLYCMRWNETDLLAEVS
jgi:probable phosphoglycerate mutase